MSDLEAQIRNLALRAPGESLDERIFSTLQSGTSAESDAEQLRAVSTRPDNSARQLRTGRHGIVMTSGWVVASVSMIIGLIVGNLLPSFGSLSGGDALTASPGSPQSGTFEDDGQDGFNESNPSVENQNVGLHGPDTAVGSQIVESNWLSPAAAAVVWEQQTGQIFSVVNHIRDRRFNVCRDCHRVGG